MADTQQYKDLINEIVKKQMAILGPEIALLKARQVSGLKLDHLGSVASISGDEAAVLQHLVDKYIELSGQIVKNILLPVFAKYPTIKVTIP